jgi:chloramphenicol-sensitive protein RarD
VLQALRNPTARRYLSASGVLLYFNWFIYIWSVNNGHILDSSLGYYITPLLNVLCGRLFFRDRLNRLQWGSITLAALGVAVLLIRYGRVPWIALSLAGTFAGYGLLRKMAPVESIPWPWSPCFGFISREPWPSAETCPSRTCSWSGRG